MPNDELKLDTEKTPASPKNTVNFQAILRHLWNTIRHNWAWKVTCVVLAVCLWGGLISQDSTLLRARVFNDVTINVLNADTLQRNGYIVVSGLEEEQLSGVRIKVDVPQKYYNQVTAANYNVRVDLSKIRQAGEQVLPVTATSTSTYGTVTEISVAQLTVTVEEYVPRSRIPVRIETTGEAPNGFYAEAASVDPLYVAIAGPKSLVESVVRCVALYDMSLLTAQAGQERSAVPFVLYDKQDNIVPHDEMTVTTGGVSIDSIIVEQKLYAMSELPVATVGLTTGKLPAGYEIKSIMVEPSHVKIAFSDAAAQAQTQIYPKGTIDLTGATGPIVTSVSLDRPDGIKYMSANTIYVTVDIGPITE